MSDMQLPGPDGQGQPGAPGAGEPGAGEPGAGEPGAGGPAGGGAGPAEPAQPPGVSAWEPAPPVWAPGPPGWTSTPSWAGAAPQPSAARGGRGRQLLIVAMTAILAAVLGGVIVTATRHAPTASAAGGPAVSAAAAPTLAEAGGVQSALATIEPSVVAINTTGNDGQLGVRGAGSGIITSSSGEVLTNAHVVSGASSIRVQIPGRSGTVPASVVGADATADLAVLKLQGVSGLHAATFAAASTVHVGDTVLAIGNAEGYGGAPSVTEGIISALNRDLPGDSGTLHGLLQTDAAINPGNSGGALVDTSGRVVGVTTAVATGSRGQPAQNIGFAIPSDTALKALPALRAGRNTTQGGNTTSNSAFLGVGLDAGGQGGALVGSVESGTPAASAGIQAGDLIVAVNGQRISSADDLRAALAQHKPGDRVSVSWQRNGSTQSATVTLARRPASSG